MALPMEIGDAAQDAESARVLAWLDEGGGINDRDHRPARQADHREFRFEFHREARRQRRVLAYSIVLASDELDN